MRRKFISIQNLQYTDEMHYFVDRKLVVDELKDGQSLEKHLEGIAYIKSLLDRGQKTRPILVVEHADGTFTRLDGFKRTMAHLEANRGVIEAFVCTEQEMADHKPIPYDGHEMTCWKGGQPKEFYTLQEGGERPNFNYDKIDFLYNSPNPHGLKIEVCEAIHVHWNEFGRFRLTLGRKDFEALAEAVSNIEP